MSLKDALQVRELVETVTKQSWSFGRAAVLERGLAYYDEHPGDVERIRQNLEHMGLDGSQGAVRASLEGVIAHYYEKLFVMTKDFEAHWLIENRIDFGDALSPIEENRARGRGLFLGQSHFGGAYLLVPALMTRGLDVTFVALFPPPVFAMLRANIERYAARWSTGKVRLLNVAEEGALIAEIMMGALRAGEIVMNVFDENNAFSRQVSLMGRSLWGGSGMDRILAPFGPEKVDVITPFMVRTGEDSFRLETEAHSLGSDDIVQDMYRSLGKRVSAHPDQWYFIQELHHSFEQIT
jgi:lauroyl/myristoyl acyltransferase